MWNGKSTLTLWVSQVVNGFHALAQDDSNLDGRVDTQDSRYASLRIWRDLNQNGISEADELLILPSAGIQTLLIESEPNDQLLDNGNVLADVGRHLRADGFETDMGIAERRGDVDHASEIFRRRHDDTIPLTEPAQSLPDMRASGLVRNLREAANDALWRNTA